MRHGLNIGNIANEFFFQLSENIYRESALPLGVFKTNGPEEYNARAVGWNEVKILV